MAQLASTVGVHISSRLAKTDIIGLEESGGLAFEAVSGVWSITLSTGVVARHALA